MDPALGETITLDFITSDATGAAAAADSTPVVEVFGDAVDTPVLTPAPAQRAGRAGDYRVQVACTAANGFAAGKSYNVVAAATVGGVAARAVIDRFVLRAYSADGVNVAKVGGQDATPLSYAPAAPGDAMTLTAAERAATTAAIKTDTGNNATAGSIGKQLADSYSALAAFAGLQITGVVAASPAPTTTSFTVTLDSALAAGKTAQGIVGQYATIRSGNAASEAKAIATCVINSTTSLSLTFSAPNAFSAAPSAGDPVSISA